jgi:response regulator of citrate/malate metabolism
VRKFSYFYVIITLFYQNYVIITARGDNLKLHIGCLGVYKNNSLQDVVSERQLAHDNSQRTVASLQNRWTGVDVFGEMPHQILKEVKMMKSIRLLIVESDLMVLFSIGQVVRYFDNYLVVDKVDSVEAAAERMKVASMDLVIVGGKDNVDNWKQFNEFSNQARVILLAQNPSKEFIQDAVACGVWDVMLRPVDPERLRLSLEMFRSRFMYLEALEFPVQQERLDAIFFPRDRQQSAVANTVKNSEMLDKVMQLIEDRDGPQSAGEIAEVLNVSRITVRKYCEALVNTGKLHVKNKYQTKGRPIKQYFLV